MYIATDRIQYNPLNGVLCWEGLELLGVEKILVGHHAMAAN
ncbi:hypothetical protein SAMN05661099_1241 [Daejeonella lutea]|uniref:Uncharacterized protein n=1 Tax=Daejeonella lutea TaxID=572036 RepID=A0A1T5B410_9SPHI|nr:hypothetical protein SAMN05661099_1241 [Daejeonella lutea]